MTYTDVLFIVLLFGLWLLTRALRRWPVAREWTIIAFSSAFVASWGLFSLALLLTVAVMNFVAIKIAFLGSSVPKRTVLTAAIVLDLLTLAVFKYTRFIDANLQTLFHSNLSIPIFATLGIPLAISFYTFHLVSYLVDITKRHTKPLPLRKFLFYICFFPHVVAGPIVRTWQLAPQLGKVRRLPTDVAFGVHYIVVGFFLKAVVANNLAQAIDPLWGSSPGWALSAADRWVTAFLYYCQIYGDFAGYSLMALGMARLLGYRLPPNFRAPLLAGTMQDFWHRWHITLSRWLRDYLYIPLGGNRQGKYRSIGNVLVTMLLGGLWHGAGWNFVIWGAMHGVGLSSERLFGIRTGRNRPFLRWGWWLCTQTWVTLAWVFFRSPDLTFATGFLLGMFRFDGISSLVIHGTLGLPMLIASGALIHQLTPLWIARVPRRRLGLYLGLATGFILVLNIIAHSPSKGFIYFKF